MRKFWMSLIGLVLLLVNFTSKKADATTKNSNDNVVSMNLVKETLKPQIMLQRFQDQQKINYNNQKLKQIQAEEKRMTQQAAQEAAKKVQEQKQVTVSQAPTSQTNTPTTSTNKGTFKLSFYDPAAMGSNMGYGGVAANLSIFPKGTRLKITLSDGTVWYKVVNDTGSFAASNPHQLDVAMPNNQVPAAGILYATVEVLG